MQRSLDPAAAQVVGSHSAALDAAYFGIFRLRRGERHCAFGHGQTLLELCRYLIARAGSAIARDELLELMWPEADPTQSAHRLHVALSKLRALLGVSAFVQFDGRHYSVPLGAVATDFALFDEQYSRALSLWTRGFRDQAEQSFTNALALYSGPYLQDAVYVGWTAAPRLHYSERYLAALTYLCESATAENDTAGVLEYASRIVEADDLRERAHRQLMIGHYRLGQRALAIRQYLRCALALERELGTRPSRETELLYAAIRDDTALPVERPFAG